MSRIGFESEQTRVDLEKFKELLRKTDPVKYARLYGECKCYGLTIMIKGQTICGKCGKLQVN